jgi:hypothetical protein
MSGVRTKRPKGGQVPAGRGRFGAEFPRLQALASSRTTEHWRNHEKPVLLVTRQMLLDQLYAAVADLGENVARLAEDPDRYDDGRLDLACYRVTRGMLEAYRREVEEHPEDSVGTALTALAQASSQILLLPSFSVACPDCKSEAVIEMLRPLDMRRQEVGRWIMNVKAAQVVANEAALRQAAAMGPAPSDAKN